MWIKLHLVMQNNQILQFANVLISENNKNVEFFVSQRNNIVAVVQ